MNAGILCVAFALPCGNLGRQLVLVVQPAIQALAIHHANFRLRHVQLTAVFGCCASKPGKPVLELCLAHLPNRGDARWKLSDNGAIKNLVQIGVK